MARKPYMEKETKPKEENKKNSNIEKEAMAGEVVKLTKSQATRKALAAQPTKLLYIHKDEKEPEGITLPVIINGCRFNIPKGVDVEVPEQVYKIVRDSEAATSKAFADAKERLAKAVKLEFDNTK